MWWCEGVDVVGQTSVLQGAAQPPPLPLLSRLYSSLCSLCVQILPAECFYTAPVLLHYISVGKERKAVCVCVASYHCFLRSLFTCTCVGVSPTVWNHSRATAVLSTEQQQIWQKLPLACGPHLNNLTSIGRVNFYPQLTE